MYTTVHSLLDESHFTRYQKLTAMYNWRTFQLDYNHFNFVNLRNQGCQAVDLKGVANLFLIWYEEMYVYCTSIKRKVKEHICILHLFDL